MNLKQFLSRLTGRGKPEATAGMQFPSDSPYALRHQLEYTAIPSLFYPSHLESGESIFQMWKSFHDRAQIPFPYHPDDFRVDISEAEDGTRISRIDLPEPEADGLCWRVYCLLNTKDSIMISFCLEKCSKRNQTALVAIRPDQKQFALGYLPLYRPGDKNYESMMSAETVMILNYIGRTL